MRRMVPDERRALIIRVAGELFSAHPYAGVSVADIAQAAGVSPPLIMFHFGSKRALYLTVIQAAADAIRAGLQAVPGPPSLDRLRACLRFYAGYARDHRAGFLSLLRGGQELPLPEVARITGELRADVAGQILADLAATGHPAATAGPATMIAIRGYLGYVDAAIVDWLSLADPEREQISLELIAGLAVGALTGGLAAVPASGPATQAGPGGPA